MGVEVAEPVNDSHGKPEIQFGSHGEDEQPIKVETSKVFDSNLPKDAVDEWPEPKQIHSFYIVRLRSAEDQNLKAKLELAEKELQKKNQSRSQIVEKLKAKRAERSNIIGQIRSLSTENKQFRSIIDEKRKEMEPLQQALGKLRGSSGQGRGERGFSGICSSEEELNDVIKSLQYRIQHESIPLSEEKQILREIKQLEGTREQVRANAAERAKIQESLGEKEDIQGQVKSIGVDLDGVKKEKKEISAKIKQLDEEKMAVEKQIGALEDELTAVSEKRDKTFESIKEMRKQRDEGNSPFYQYRTVVTKARVLAANKDIDALKELLHSEVENFMSLWNTNKTFRDDYEKRVLPSLDTRQLSRDGRMRNPSEQPLIKTEKAPTSSESEVVVKGAKQTPEEKVVSDVPKPKTAAAKSQKEANKTVSKKIEPVVEEEEEFYVEKPRKDLIQKKDEVDEKKLIELKREEELAKRKQAEERKKKLAEKAAAKAAIRAQKEAEKKLKDREKRTRKKTGATVSNEENEEPKESIKEEVNVEPEKTEEKEVQTSAPYKKKETGIKRRARGRGTDSLPKAILKRKKATNYWVWGGAAALVMVLVLMVVGYYYVS